MRKKSYLTVTDQFCGAGGTTLGATMAGFEVMMAMNHWKLAIETHNTNFPQVAHDCADISQCDPRRYESTDILTTSPECTNHSIAKGVSRRFQQPTLWGDKPDPAAERSRSTMWDVPRFAEFHDYRMIIVENVVDARAWVLWPAWIQAMDCLGYDHKTIFFNSQFALPTPQSRDRMYVVFWKRGIPKPDLEFRPIAPCRKCGKNLESYQAWKPGRTWGKYRTQYLYRCTGCHSEVEPFYCGAFTAIDWRLPCPRVGDRIRPLKEKTIERIRVGLKKFVAPYILGHGMDASYRSTQDPMQTIVASGNHHFLVTLSHSHAKDSGKVKSASKPLPTLTTTQDQALVTTPFLMGMYSPGWVRPAEKPFGTITCDDHHALCMPPAFQLSYRNDANGDYVVKGVDEPIPTITAEPQHYLSSYYGGSVQNSPMTDALPTIPTRDRHALVEANSLDPNECGFRMLTPQELQKGMAFPDEYKILGGKKDQVRQLGNALTPPVMAMILGRCAESLR